MNIDLEKVERALKENYNSFLLYNEMSLSTIKTLSILEEFNELNNLEEDNNVLIFTESDIFDFIERNTIMFDKNDENNNISLIHKLFNEKYKRLVNINAIRDIGKIEIIPNKDWTRTSLKERATLKINGIPLKEIQVLNVATISLLFQNVDCYIVFYEDLTYKGFIVKLKEIYKTVDTQEETIK